MNEKQQLCPCCKSVMQRATLTTLDGTNDCDHYMCETCDLSVRAGIWEERTQAFEIGKYYMHSSCGTVMHIIGALNTTLYGWCFIAEEHGGGRFKPLGFKDDSYSQNWKETTKSHWLTGFSAKT